MFNDINTSDPSLLQAITPKELQQRLDEYKTVSADEPK